MHGKSVMIGLKNQSDFCDEETHFIYIWNLCGKWSQSPYQIVPNRHNFLWQHYLHHLEKNLYFG